MAKRGPKPGSTRNRARPQNTAADDQARGQTEEQEVDGDDGEQEQDPPPAAGHNSGETLEVLSDDQRRALTVIHRDKYKTLLAEKKAADKALKDFGKVVKADLGADGLDDIKDLIAGESTEGEAKLIERMRSDAERTARIARWLSLPEQFQTTMDFDQPDRTPLVDRALAEGERAGLDGKTCVPPYDGEGGQKWIEGWHNGQAKLAAGFKLLQTPVEQAAYVDEDFDEALANATAATPTAEDPPPDADNLDIPADLRRTREPAAA